MKNILRGVALILLAWSFFHYTAIASPLLLPSPVRSIQTMFEYLSSGMIYTDLVMTGYRWGVGYLGGIATGIPIGLLMGSSRRVNSALEFPVDFFRSLPVTALFPMFLLAFGIGDASKIAMVWAAVIFVMIINSFYGVTQSSPRRRLMARIYGATEFQIFTQITFYEALPQIIVGMRLALSTSLIVVIVSEMFIGTQFGLGQKVYDLYSKNLVTNLFAVLLLMGVIGYLLNKIFVYFESKIIFWVGKQ